jgi:hypothetical protein
VKAALVFVGAAAISTPLLLQQQSIQRLKTDKEHLEQTITVLGQELAAHQRALGEVERFRRENVELHKLRGEVGSLKDRIRGLEKLNASLSTAAVQSESAESATPPPQVSIRTRYAEMPLALLQELQGMGIAVPSDQTIATVLVSEQIRRLEEFLEKKEGVDLVSAPSVTTLDKRQARIAIENNIIVEGKDWPFGTVLDVVPEVAADRESTTLKLEATYREFLGLHETDKLPRFRTRQTTTAGRIRPSEALLMQALPLQGPDDAAKKMIVMVTSTILNPDGSVWTRSGQ